MATRVSPLKI